VSSVKYSPRWVKFSVKQSDQIAHAIETLKKSQQLLKAAIKAGEPTAYFSGGIKPGSEEVIDTEDDPEDKS